MDTLPVLSEIFSSSSSNDEESVEELIDIFYMGENENRRKRKRARVENFIETVVHIYDNEEFRENFRYINKIIYLRKL